MVKTLLHWFCAALRWFGRVGQAPSYVLKGDEMKTTPPQWRPARSRALPNHIDYLSITLEGTFTKYNDGKMK